MAESSLASIIRSSFSGPDFSLEISALESSILNAMAAAFFANGRIRLSEASARYQAADVVVSGTGVDLPFTGMAVAAAFSQNARQGLSLKFTATAPVAWTPASSFPYLGVTVIGSLPFTAEKPAKLGVSSDEFDANKPLLSFTGQLDLRRDSGALPILLGSTSQQLTGTLNVQESGTSLLEIDLSGPFAEDVNLGFAEVRQLTFSIGSDPAYNFIERAFYAMPYVQFAATIPFSAQGKGYTIPLLVQSVDLSSSFRFQAGLADLIAAGIGEISALIKADFSKLIPPGVHPEEVLKIADLFFDINLADPHIVTAIGVSIKSGELWSLPLARSNGDKIAASNVELDVLVLDPFGSPLPSLIASAEFVLGSGTLDVSARYPDLEIGCTLEPETTLRIGELIQDLIGSDIPVPEVDIDELMIFAGSEGYSLSAGLSAYWQIGDFPAYIDDMEFSIAKEGSAAPIVNVSAKFPIRSVAIEVSASYDSTTGWSFSGGLNPYQELAIGELLTSFTVLFGVELPAAVKSFVLTAMHLEFDMKGTRLLYSASGTFAIAGQTANTGITFVSGGTSKSGYQIDVSGRLSIANMTLELSFDKSASSNRVTGTWSSTQSPVSFSQLAGFFGVSEPLLIGAAPAMTQISLSYDFSQESLATAVTLTGAHLALFALKNPLDNTRAYVVSLGLETVLNLTSLPVIGDKIPASDNLGIEKFQLLYSTANLTQAQTAQLNQMIPSSSRAFPDKPLAKGFSGVIPLVIGGSPSAPMVIPVAGDVPPPAPGKQIPPAAPPGLWLKVERTFGPLTISRVGVTHADGTIWILLDAGFTLGGLTVNIEGAGIGFTIANPPVFAGAVSGLDIQYSSGPVEIYGGFLESQALRGEYDGEALIQAQTFTLSAIGSYAKVNGDASLFLFAFLGVPLGGPSFFFVTGIAAGFGFNRALVIPSLSKLPEFPLTAAAMANVTGQNPFQGKTDDIHAALAVMHDYIPPAEGEYWLAAGVRFTSFEMITTFALVTASFGTNFELALLGLSTITIPTGAPDPIGFAELALEIIFAPLQGLLAARAQLTPESYILSHRCQLTGGFAFYLWFLDSTDGASAGEFVLTFGGYAPGFDLTHRKYYPVVPRIGANWKVDDNLNLNASLYFALLPSTVMAGGYLQATWQSSGISAWFNADANFLLGWKPFRYSANISVHLGASFTISLLFTTVTLTIHAGVDLSLWGPSFAGRARVDLDVISFTVYFGNSSPSNDPIPWSEFKSSFLPPTNYGPPSAHPVSPAALDGQTDTPIVTETYCTSSVTTGLLKDLKNNGANPNSLDWVVDPNHFVIATNSVFPSKQAYLVSGNGSATNPAIQSTPVTGSWNIAFGVGPVGIADGNFESTHTVSLFKLIEGTEEYQYDFVDHAITTPMTRNIPQSAWSADLALSPSISKVNSSATTIANALAGFQIAPRPVVPDYTLAIDIGTLQSTRAPIEPAFDWAAPSIPTNDPFNQSIAMGTLMSGIGSASVSAERLNLIQALNRQNLALDADVSVAGLETSANLVLLDPPTLSYLGEERNA